MSGSLVPMSNRLMRSNVEKRFTGVCGGIAEYYGIDPTIVRIVFVVLAIGGGTGFLIYPLLWLIMPVRTGGAPSLPAQPAVQPGPGARFDPMTGRPIAAEAPRFDPYTGQPLPAETAIPITNAGAAAPTLPYQERRRRFVGVALAGLAAIMILNAVSSLGPILVPALLILGGFMLLRRG